MVFPGRALEPSKREALQCRLAAISRQCFRRQAQIGMLVDELSDVQYMLPRSDGFAEYPVIARLQLKLDRAWSSVAQDGFDADSDSGRKLCWVQ